MPSYLSPGVYVEEVSSGSRPIEGVGTAVAAFVGFAEKGPLNEPSLVTNWTQFGQLFGEFSEGRLLAHAVYAYFLNGGGSAYVVRVPEPGDGPTHATRALADADGTPLWTVRAVQPGAAGNALGVKVEVGAEDAPGTFRLVVLRDGRPAETHDRLTADTAADVIGRKSRLITLESAGATDAGGPRLPAPGFTSLESGADSGTGDFGPQHFVGDALERTGLSGLEAVDAVTMLAVPDVMSALERGLLDRDGVRAVQQAMIAHAELMSDRIAILDTPPALNASEVRAWRVTETGFDSKYAALYWPWLKVMDPATGKPRMVPPSGHVAGVWARSDETRGVHKAPANETLRGPIALELAITRREHDHLNPLGVNCIRVFPGQGIRVWGARTLSSDPEWRYLSVRRLFNYVEESILQGTNWVVFEPNDPKLWDSVKRTITMFLRGVWRDGALYGRTADDAFYVKCDEENNPADARDQGILTVEVGIAAVKPAEFIVFRISQYSDGAALDE
ncbi:phage tail sheath family protein [Streptomyces sp. NPDC090021]|uniref:phage tail sheath family protein n=1 Tax=Streptomyces sp. NPDC090021 TaxID=3365919 RepID=UPI00380C72B7